MQMPNLQAMREWQDTDALDEDLHARAVERASTQRRPDPVSRALELAFAGRNDDRAWVLIRLAADLRVLGDMRRALTVLDAAAELRPSAEVRRAIDTCAIACHCDLGTHATAELIERQSRALPPDLHLARAAARLYAELFAQTGADEHRDRRCGFSALVAELESEADGAGIAL